MKAPKPLRLRRICRLRRIKIVLPLLFFSWPGYAQVMENTFRTGAPPAWAEWVNADSKRVSETKTVRGGELLMLIDTQVNVQQGETFTHTIKEIVTEAGVQGSANLGFTWDPSYQELTLHQITIHRGTEHLDKLEPSKFRIIQQETDLNRQIYNGALSAVLFLEDVRVGDQIECAFTIRGENPSLRGHYAESFTMAGPLAISRRRVRLLWPVARELRWRSYGKPSEPESRSHGDLTEYTWDSRDVPAVLVEDQTPSWFPAYPWIQVSEYRNWSEVAAWAAGLYAATNLDAPELKGELARLSNPGGTTQQTIRAALEFTQNDVRYLGIEFGPGSYRPSDPATVLRRRFGDCKDKAFLLCTLLRGLGYQAVPVMVGTGFRHTLPEMLPAPHDFDHVIVRVSTEGRTYWLDPTRSYQRAPVGERFLPRYGFGLVGRKGETELTPIPALDAGAPATFTTEAFHVGGQKAVTELAVTTLCKGFDAEWMRAVLATQGREWLAKEYLNDYAQRYPGIRPSAGMVIEDASNADQVKLTHTYSISNFWMLSTDKERYSCQFYPLGIHSWITKPTAAVRSMPIEFSFPRRRSVRTVIELPIPFRLSNFTNLIVGPGAELWVKRQYHDRRVWLDYDYRSLTNFIPLALIPAHLGSLDRMENVLGYTLQWQSQDGLAGSSQFNWPVFALAFFYAAFLCLGAILVYRYQCCLASPASPVPPALPGDKIAGLGGWLILVGIAIVVSPLRLLSIILSSAGSFSLYKWHALTSPGGVSYHPLWGPLLILELLGHLTQLILTVFAAVLFFEKRRLFPRAFIGVLLFNAIFIVGDFIGVQFLHTSSEKTTAILARNFTQVVIGCSIWIPYMCISRRVKATFLR